MRFIIGGRYSGKRAYVKERYGITDIPDADRENVITAEAVGSFNRLACSMPPEDITDVIDMMLAVNPDIIVISDEVGCGVVPIDKSEREYRETVGRVNCYLAKKAEEVVRVVCGIGQKLK